MLTREHIAAIVENTEHAIGPGPNALLIETIRAVAKVLKDTADTTEYNWDGKFTPDQVEWIFRAYRFAEQRMLAEAQIREPY